MFSSKVHVCTLCHFSGVRLFAALWTVAHQVPLSMEILQARVSEWVAMLSSRASFWTASPTLEMDFLLLSHGKAPGKVLRCIHGHLNIAYPSSISHRKKIWIFLQNSKKLLYSVTLDSPLCFTYFIIIYWQRWKVRL